MLILIFSHAFIFIWVVVTPGYTTLTPSSLLFIILIGRHTSASEVLARRRSSRPLKAEDMSATNSHQLLFLDSRAPGQPAILLMKRHWQCYNGRHAAAAHAMHAGEMFAQPDDAD